MPEPRPSRHRGGLVLVHNIMVYYDSAHMTPPWSLFIAPVLDTAITSILSSSRGPSHSIS